MDLLMLSGSEKYNNYIPLSIKFIEKYCTIPINKIYVVSKERVKMEGVINFTDEEWLHEYLLKNIGDLGFKKNTQIWSHGWERQQYIKLSAPWFIDDIDDFLVIDPDAFLLHSFTPIEHNKQNFIIAPPDRGSYHRLNKHLFRIPSQEDYSFISEIMFFQKNILSKIKTFIENKHDGFWLIKINQIIKYLRKKYPQENFFLSEYEIYGNFMTNFYPDMVGKFHKHLHGGDVTRVDIDLTLCSVDEFENYIRDYDKKRYKKYPDFKRWIKHVEMKE